MKKYITLAILMALAIPLAAQHDGPRHEKKARPEISEIVSDLSAPQKRKIENITRQSRERIDNLRAKKRAVSDTIARLIEQEGDHSSQLNPLFEHEAYLQVAINREMYATKLRIDEILTREQRAVLRDAGRKDKAALKDHPRHVKH